MGTFGPMHWLIVAVVVLDDAHVTLAVMFCVELSL